MKKFHPFYIIGTVGTIITGMLHIFLALGLSISGAHTSFFVIYPLFLTFLMIGLGLTLKKEKQVIKVR